MQFAGLYLGYLQHVQYKENSSVKLADGRFMISFSNLTAKLVILVIANIFQ